MLLPELKLDKKEYLKKADYDYFCLMREMNRISFFRTNICNGEECEKEVPSNVIYCSKECYLNNEEVENEYE
jgi:hypothetical protein